MKRHIFQQLKAWKQDPKRKPLILMGARQVGKTHILKKLAASAYEHNVYLNFEDKPSLKALFEGDLEPAKLLQLLSIETGEAILPEKTLIIFDEIQECPAALNSLKYFYESANEYSICAAGSLLGVKLSHTKGFPVGKVNFLHLYPLTFFEFLDAVGEVALREYLQQIKKIEPLPISFHEKLLDYFKIYSFVGGMPEAVVEYVESKNFSKVREIQKAILNAYSLDFAKHAPPNQLMRINQVWEATPSQLAKENKKFIYSLLKTGARAKEYEVALQWLQEAGLIHKVFCVSSPQVPLKAYEQLDYFKVYLLDVGLLGAMTSLSEKVIIEGHSLFKEFKGSFAENVVMQTLATFEESLYYWTSEGKAELDSVIQHENNIYPLEITSGLSNKKKSLRVYADKYMPTLLLRVSPNNVKKDGKLLNCPFYALECLKQWLSAEFWKDC